MTALGDAAGRASLPASPPSTDEGYPDAAPAVHGAARGAAGRLPVLPVARARHDGAAATTPSPAAPGIPASPGGSGAGGHAPAATIVRPTMGHRPIHASHTAQREAAESSTPEPGAQVASAAAPVVARWESRDDLPATVLGGPAAGRAADAVPIPVQMSPLVAASGASPDSQGLSREITFPQREGPGRRNEPVGEAAAARVADLTSSQAWSPSRTASGGFAAGPASVPGGLGAGDPHRPLTLARSAMPGATAPSAGATGAARTTVGHIVADPVSPAAPPTVQAVRNGAPPGTPVAAITATPVVQRAEGAAPAAENGTGEHSDSELDELARALFGRIRSHLRTEMIHEREAKGLTFDAF